MNRRVAGFSLIEMLVVIAISAVVVAAMSSVLGESMRAYDAVSEQSELTREAQFAMQQMVRVVSHSRRLLLPLADNPNTNWPEHIREQTEPPSPPIGDSTLATAVLAVTLPAYVDLDADGFPDADDDRDGRIDEDLPNDAQHDFQPGIMLIDDDGDGDVDDGAGWAEDDEDGDMNEDPIDGVDNDGDGSVDEDPPSDTNNDTCPGICGVDDDENGTVDGVDAEDDDEDGNSLDDPYDPVVFYMQNGVLYERMPVPWNEDGIDTPDGPVDGRDFIASKIVAHVTRFRVERIPQVTGQPQLVDITLELTSRTTDETISLNTQVRVGGSL